VDRTIKDTLAILCEKSGGHVSFDERLAAHSTMFVGGSVSAWYVPATPEELQETVVFLRDAGVWTFVIGNGSNVLMPDGPLDAVAINLGSDYFTHKKFEGSEVTVGAGEKLDSFISLCCARGLSGLEGLVGIPGTVGGALVMNAGYKSPISNCLVRVKLIDGKGNIRNLEKRDISFGYRRSSFNKEDIIIEAVFGLKEMPLSDLREKMQGFFLEKLRSQPLDQKTLGCIFKNPEKSKYKSAELIEMAGMKGARCGNAVISQRHSNFIVNSGNASAKDVKTLIREVQDKVRADFSIDLIPEIEVL